ncbi:MAG: guanosine-3',5'-bis(diphosphate) 3'-pyrophosphohydrolase [Flavobacteriaceae bacterium]|jgi:guanosine-3',5'-bis(diphosphate) 3'-pyrophosphohydrolase
MHDTHTITFNELISAIHYPLSKEDTALIKKAYGFAFEAHDGQKRNSGEPYFNHVVSTAKNLADFNMSPVVISAGLLHDTIEDTDVTEYKMKKEFGAEITRLVEGVTKLGTLKYRGVERHVESLRKFFIAMSRDLRIVVIKLADRLHNIQTLQFVRPDKQKRIAQETIEIHAPLANKLGMGRLRNMLEDGAFPYAYPEEYKLVSDLLKTKATVTQKKLQKVRKKVITELGNSGLRDITATERIKSKFSLYKKLQKYEMDIEKVHDLVALRILVNSMDECYRALGIIHSVWKPLPGRVKDYIASPKPNGYQSLHTSIFLGDGSVAEIQIRTHDMHKRAEYGIAAHEIYKLQDVKKLSTQDIEWIKKIKNKKVDKGEYESFLNDVKVDFFLDRIFVFTPKGDVVDLPAGASMIDFAYAIHSDIGDHAIGGYIDGKYTALKTPLKNKAIVEIKTDKKSHPSSKWLDFATTSTARKHIITYTQKHTILGRFFT